MIKMKMLSGPHAGKVSDTSGLQPEELLSSALEHGWQWEIDYSQATEEEKFRWLAQDIAVRCVRALAAGLPVRFMDRTFQIRSKDPEQFRQVAGELEDLIVNSGRIITLGSDDENGVVIKEGGFVN